ncbi:MAG: T9SS type A sorting domain-containing protein [Ignavibacteriae bacterium]|nr:T9SS type A sorting domain-containing protein [Ignavibacteriota bacterium]
MKKLIYTFALVLIVHCTLYIENCMAQWVQMPNGMGTSLSVNGLAISGNNIFAGTGNYPSLTGVYLSTNNGENWTQTALNNCEVGDVATLGNNIFAGVVYNGKGFYRSTNNGTSWTLTGLNNLTIQALAILGTDVFAGTHDSGVYRSTNNGTNWIHTSLNNKTVYSLAVSGNNIFAGTNGYGVCLSTNNGTDWTQVGLISEQVISLGVSGNNIFAGTNGFGNYVTTNNGMNWAQISLSSLYVNTFAVTGNNIFAGGGGIPGYGVFLSTNNGTSWTEINQGFPAYPHVRALLIANNYIFAGIIDISVWRRPLSEIINSVNNISTEIPSSFSLSQNYPNPFNPTTKISFQLSVAGFSSLKIFDLLGKEVATLVNETLKPGTYTAAFDGSQLPSGVYLYRLTTNEYTSAKSMLLIK